MISQGLRRDLTSELSLSFAHGFDLDLLFRLALDPSRICDEKMLKNGESLL